MMQLLAQRTTIICYCNEIGCCQLAVTSLLTLLS